MKIVALGSPRISSQNVFGRVAQSFSLDHLVEVRPESRPSSWKQQARNLLRGKLVSGLERRCFYASYFRSLEDTVRTMTEEDITPWTPAEVLPVPLRELHAAATVEKISRLQPDVLLVCSAPLLKPQVFSIPKIATVNVHFGISPQYRGDQTLFWPLYYGDYEHLGVTVHRIDAGVDTGEILAHGFPALDPNDNEATIWAKCLRLAGDVVVETLAAFDAGNTRGQLQTESGRLFRARDRRVWHDLKYRALHRLGLRTPPNRAERIELYCRSGERATVA